MFVFIDVNDKNFTPYFSKLFFQLNNFLMGPKYIHVTIMGIINLNNE